MMAGGQLAATGMYSAAVPVPADASPLRRPSFLDIELVVVLGYAGQPSVAVGISVAPPHAVRAGAASLGGQPLAGGFTQPTGTP
jgi:hypothetical protein